MTEYKVMAKGKYNKRFRCFGDYNDPKFADKNVQYLANSLWTSEVKIIVKDKNGIANTLFYKQTR